MQTTNIPTYRAKKIGTENEWVEGYFIGLTPDNPNLIVCLIETPMCPDTGYIETYVENIEIDPNTLAIHFPNMIDKNGKKIFASLSEDGVGGDIVRHKNSQKENGFNKFTVIYDNWQIRAMNKADGKFGFRNAFGNEVIGIHKGE